MKVVVVYSGGLDSTVLLYHLRDQGHEVQALSVDYGQRHRRELDAAGAICSQLGVPHGLADLSSLRPVFAGLALTSKAGAIPRGPYSPSSMQATTVPNRNMLLIAVALAWAVREKLDAVAYAAHAGVSTTYPDCTPAFAEAMAGAAHVCDWRPLEVLAPFITWKKADIVRRGAELNVPFTQTWSCYGGGDQHCGECGTCHERRAAFALAGVVDSTEYRGETP
ncbi:MAG: 7-cyano-7-deazaguanine synthase QueC [Planctomycetes bacterium]|nr:7-cyano-7-deazaguanine synthase QueC [Planctomycetota bacterium]